MTQAGLCSFSAAQASTEHEVRYVVLCCAGLSSGLAHALSGGFSQPSVPG